MTNISFDRPYLFFLIIPLLLLIFIPFFIAVRRENLTKGTLISLILHVIIAFAVTVVATGASMTTVITETRVVVLADVSHSAEKNLDVIDGYINEVKGNLPKNSKLSVVAFGNNQKTVTEYDEKFESVKNSGVDDGGTDIKSALNYAAGLLEGDVIKRIVLITDAKQTTGAGFSDVISTIDSLYTDGVYIDAIYLDSNLNENDCEVQLTSVDFTAVTFLNHVSYADVLIQSSLNGSVPVTVRLMSGDEVIDTQYPILTQGFNVVNLKLPTDKDGTFDYRITAEVEESAGKADLSDMNNELSFTQTVSGKVSVLLLTDDEKDLDKAIELYGEDAEITAYLNDPTLVISPTASSSVKKEIEARKKALSEKYAETTVKLHISETDIPCTTDTLALFDEYVISDVDIRLYDNALSFVSSVTKLISDYGKSLMTFGNTHIQNQTDKELLMLDSILPVNYGNADQESKLVCMVIDTSRSMENYDKLNIARAAAKQILSLLSDTDSLIIINFFGDYTTVWPETPIGGYREKIIDTIDNMKAQQGTLLAKGMKEAYTKLVDSTKDDKQIFLISDGRSWSNEDENAVDITRELYSLGIPTSVLNTCTEETLGDEVASGAALKLLKDIAREGDGGEGEGHYYFIKDLLDLDSIILSEVIDDITDTVVEGDLPVNVKIQSDKVLEGVLKALPDVHGYIYSKIKPSAVTVLSSDYKTRGGSIKEAPLYAYWKYGDGRVATFTSTLSGKWVSEYNEGDGKTFIQNVINTAIPSERHTVPFTVYTDVDGGERHLTLVPDVLTFDGAASITITYPNGNTEVKEMLFNSKNYTSSFSITDSGKYVVTLTYIAGGKEYSEVRYISIPYSAEYDRFTTFTISDLHKIVRTKGNVYKNADFKLENNEGDVATYTLYFTAPLMILAVCLFVLDIMFRKLRWKDIQNLFGEKDKVLKGGNGK